MLIQIINHPFPIQFDVLLLTLITLDSVKVLQHISNDIFYFAIYSG